ncbi:MAG: ribbon-helix-helix domain-containing protein [Acetobacteraceae bacterium]
MSDTTLPCSFTLPRSLVERIDAVAQAEDRSRSQVVRRVLALALPDPDPAAPVRTFQARHARRHAGANDEQHAAQVAAREAALALNDAGAKGAPAYSEASER